MVQQARGVVTITAKLLSSHQAACLTNVEVYADGAQAQPIWYLVSPLQAPCRTTVTLGRNPTGFGPDDGAPLLRLEPGRTYIVNVRGRGWTADTDFVAAR